MSLKIAFIKANGADLDERLPYVAFHPDHHCLPKYMYLSTSIQNEEKG